MESKDTGLPNGDELPLHDEAACTVKIGETTYRLVFCEHSNDRMGERRVSVEEIHDCIRYGTRKLTTVGTRMRATRYCPARKKELKVIYQVIDDTVLVITAMWNI